MNDRSYFRYLAVGGAVLFVRSHIQLRCSTFLRPRPGLAGGMRPGGCPRFLTAEAQLTRSDAHIKAVGFTEVCIDTFI
jgi:hypothetical protein